MNGFKKILQKPWAAYTIATCSAVLLYVLLSNLPSLWGGIKKVFSFLSPVFTGAVVAYLMNPLALFFERKCFKKIQKPNSRRIAGSVLAIVVVVLALLILIGSLIPSLVKSVTTIVNNWSNYVEALENVSEKIEPLAARFNIDLSNLSELTGNLMNKALNLLQDNKDTILQKLSAAGSSISDFAVGLLLGVCFLFGKNSILSAFKKLRSAIVKENRIQSSDAYLSRFNSVFVRYLTYTLLDSLIVGFCTLIFMLIDNASYAALIAVLVAVTNIIPTFGPMIGAAISIFFLVLDKPLSALWFFIFICILQSLDGMVIKPRLFKGSLGISGVWTLVLIALGGRLAGIAGIILCIPLAAMFSILYKEAVSPRLENRKLKINSSLVK